VGMREACGVPRFCQRRRYGGAVVWHHNLMISHISSGCDVGILWVG